MKTNRLSIDPGLWATGIAVWPPEGGLPLPVTIRPKGDSWFARLADLASKAAPFLDHASAVAIEDFVSVYPKQRADSLKKLFTATGVLIGLALARNIPVRTVCKGTETKAKTNAVVALFGKPRASQDARDAIYLGLLAGFHKPISEDK